MRWGFVAGTSALVGVAIALSSSGSPRLPAAQAQPCQTSVRTRAALVAAVDGRANEGRAVCLRAGDYGDVTLRGRHARHVTIRPHPGESPSIGSISLEHVSRLRIRGFDFRRGGITTDSSRADRVTVVGNRFHDYTGSAMMLWGGDSNITFADNEVRNLHFDGDWYTGWGLSVVGGDRGIRNLAVRYNDFVHTEQDAMEIGNVTGGDIVGNLIRDVKPPRGTDAHTDSLMLWAGSRRFLIRDNRFEDGHGLLLSGSTSDVRLDNNLVVRMENWCQDAGPTGSSGEGVVRYTWVHNTIYDCGSDYDDGGFGGTYGFGSLGPATSGATNRASHNVLTSLSVDTHSQFAYEGYNVIVNGPRRGTHDVGVRPRFANRVTYRATNLPFSAGYKAAPVGRYPCSGLHGARRSRCTLRRTIARTCTRVAGFVPCTRRVRLHHRG